MESKSESSIVQYPVFLRDDNNNIQTAKKRPMIGKDVDFHHVQISIPRRQSQVIPVRDATHVQKLVQQMLDVLDVEPVHSGSCITTEPAVVVFTAPETGQPLIYSSMSALSNGGYLSVHVSAQTEGYNDNIVIDWRTLPPASSWEKEASKLAAIWGAVVSSYSVSVDNEVLPNSNNNKPVVNDTLDPSSSSEITIVKQMKTSTNTRDFALQLRHVAPPSQSTTTMLNDLQLYDETQQEIITTLREQTVYYESLVHPAFMASPLPVKRVLIVGGGTGGALREVLKYPEVQHVTTVWSPKDVLLEKGKHLPGVNDCSSFSEYQDCFADPRVTTVTTESFFEWLQTHMGPTFCEDDFKENNVEKVFDLILVDKLDVESMRGIPWPSASSSSDDSEDEDKSSSNDTDRSSAVQINPLAEEEAGTSSSSKWW